MPVITRDEARALSPEAQELVYAKVNEKGRANLIEWLSAVLKDGDLYAEIFADDLIQRLDGSYALFCGKSVEIGQFYTVSGRPMTYDFGPDELDFHYNEDDC